MKITIENIIKALEEKIDSTVCLYSIDAKDDNDAITKGKMKYIQQIGLRQLIGWMSTNIKNKKMNYIAAVTNNDKYVIYSKKDDKWQKAKNGKKFTSEFKGRYNKQPEIDD